MNFTEWTDLEKLIEWEGSSWIFFGDRPETSTEFFMRWIFIMGVSTVAAARDRRGKPMRFRCKGRAASTKKESEISSHVPVR
jgi:hypothetical protein